MNDLVTIEITTTQVVDGQKDVSTATYEGRCSIMGEVAKLRYVTKDENGSVITKIELHEDGCLLENTGDLRRGMKFIPGKRTVSKMQLPMGCFEMVVDTHTYDLHVLKDEPKCMKIILEYALYTGDTLMTEIKLEIKVVVR